MSQVPNLFSLGQNFAAFPSVLFIYILVLFSVFLPCCFVSFLFCAFTPVSPLPKGARDKPMSNCPTPIIQFLFNLVPVCIICLCRNDSILFCLMDSPLSSHFFLSLLSLSLEAISFFSPFRFYAAFSGTIWVVFFSSMLSPGCCLGVHLFLSPSLMTIL